eukprot:259970_1
MENSRLLGIGNYKMPDISVLGGTMATKQVNDGDLDYDVQTDITSVTEKEQALLTKLMVNEKKINEEINELELKVKCNTSEMKTLNNEMEKNIENVKQNIENVKQDMDKLRGEMKDMKKLWIMQILREEWL